MVIEIHPIENIITKYDAFIIDLWGVVHDGYAPYENSINFINKLISSKKPITFLSNSPRPGDISKKTLIDWGINVENITIYTSGDAVREQLIKWDDEVFRNLGKKVYHLGQSRNTDLLSGLDVDITDNVSEADFLIISAFLDDDEDIATFDYTLKEAVDLKLPAICANPDMTVQHGPQLRYTAGTIAKRYQDLGGIVHYYGKPYSKVYQHIINEYLAKNISKNKIVMIGDTLSTDIQGANNINIDSTLVLTGNGRPFLAKIKAGEQNIFTDGITPTWVSYGLEKTH